jgi:hypothetical protein
VEEERASAILAAAGRRVRFEPRPGRACAPRQLPTGSPRRLTFGSRSEENVGSAAINATTAAAPEARMHPDPEIERLRVEVDKLGKVITEVMGAEFDSILSRQSEDQRAAMRWMATSLALNVTLVRLLVEHGVLTQEEVIERMTAVRRRLLHHAESMGSDADVAELFGDAMTEGQPER